MAEVDHLKLTSKITMLEHIQIFVEHNVINLSKITATFRGIGGVARMISNPVIKSINYRRDILYCKLFQRISQREN